MQKKVPRVLHLNRSDPPITHSHRPVLPDFLDSVSDSCYTHTHTLYLPLCILLVSREHRSVTSFLPASLFHLLRSHLFAALTHCLAFDVTVSLAFIFDPFPSSGHWSLWLSPCSLLLKPLHLPSFPRLTSLISFLRLPRVR